MDLTRGSGALGIGFPSVRVADSINLAVEGLVHCSHGIY